PLVLTCHPVRETLAPPAVDVVDLATVGGDDLGDPIDRGPDQRLIGVGRQDEHALVLPQHSPPLVWTAPHEGEQKDEGCPECTGRRLRQPARRGERPRRTDKARRASPQQRAGGCPGPRVPQATA